jgi:YVTN family beta-propeller protein
MRICLLFVSIITFLFAFLTVAPCCSGAFVTFTSTVNATYIPPVITASAATGTISACTGTASASPNIQQITVSGNNLSANITATAPTGFEISLSPGSSYVSRVTLTQTGGSVSSTIVYVHSAASDAPGNISGNVVFPSPSAPSQNVAVTGVVNALPTVNTVTSQTVTNGTATRAVNFSGTGNAFTWVNNTPGIGLPVSGAGNIASFAAINTGSSPVTATITVTPVSVPFAYVGNVFSNTVSVINTATNLVVSNIKVGIEPQGVAVSPDGTKVYVAAGGVVQEINTENNTVVANVSVGSNPQGMAVSPDGSLVYVADFYSNTVSVINTGNNTVIASISVGSNPIGVAVGPDGSKVYVSNQLSNTLSVINAASNTITSTIKVGIVPFGVSVSPDGSLVYVANSGSNTVSVINTVTNTVVSNIAVGTSPSGICVSPDGAYVYVTNQGTNNVSVINTATNNVISIAVGTQPLGISATPDGNFVYVTNEHSNNVSVINTKTNTVISTISVGNYPYSFGNFISPGTGCTGTPITFNIIVNPTPPVTATGTITACAGTASASPNIQQFDIAGMDLSANVVATAPPGFEVSLSPGSGYAGSVTISESGGTLNSITVYVRRQLPIRREPYLAMW